LTTTADQTGTGTNASQEKAYRKLAYYKEHDIGGHFAAPEQPQRLPEDVREAFRYVR
jgi:hypothetical protein